MNSGPSGRAHRARKRFGQNFLSSPGFVRRIVDAIDPRSGQSILEIGPGEGALTGPLLERAGRMHAVEIDRDLAAALAGRHADDGLVLHVGDALEFDYASLPAPLRVVGNLPYNISTPLLFIFETHAGRLADLHLMLQKEVVDRMAARPSSPEYGRLSVMVQRSFEVDPLFTVPPGAFHPRPEVYSSFVRLTPREGRTALPGDAFRRVVTAAFSGRRKTLRNSLGRLLAERDFEAAGINPGLRAENLSPADFAALAARLPGDSGTAGEP